MCKQEEIINNYLDKIYYLNSEEARDKQIEISIYLESKKIEILSYIIQKSINK